MNKFLLFLARSAGNITLTLIALLLLIFYVPSFKRVVFAGPPAGGPTAWGLTYESQPTGTDTIKDGDNWMRQIKEDVRGRLEVEHEFGSAGSFDNGRHRDGSAVIFNRSVEPVGLEVDDFNNTGGAGSASLDNGRIWRDTDDNSVKAWDTGAAGWEEFITRFNQPITVSTPTTLLGSPPLVQTSGAADSMNLFAHALGATGRHRLTGTSGSWINAKDGIPFAIQQILMDNTNACTVVNTTALASQTFSTNSCFSIATDLNFTGRTTTLSRLFVVGYVDWNSNGTACTATGAIYLDNMATAITVLSSANANSGIDSSTMVMMGYITTVTAASHTIAMHLTDSTQDGCIVSGGSMFAFDLGNTPES